MADTIKRTLPRRPADWVIRAATLVADIEFILAIMTADTRTSSLSDSDYRALTQALLDGIEARIDRWLQDDLIDIDSHRTGGLLELAFPDGSKIIVNTQPPLHEVWLAAKAGGFHYRWDGRQWVDTRDGSEFLATLSQHASTQGGRRLDFSA